MVLSSWVALLALAPGLAGPIEGTVQTLHTDNFEAKTSQKESFLKTPTQTYPLKTQFQPGSTVRLSDTQEQLVAAPPAPTAATGSKRTAVIMFNFVNDPSQPFTPTQARQTVFAASTSVAAYYQEQSFNKLSLNGDVFGWYTLAYANSPCDFTAWTQAARTLAVSQGLNLANYDNFIYTFPGTSCPGDGWAWISGTEAWLKSGSFTVSRISHELGHNFGLDHANAYACHDATDKPMAISEYCSVLEYMDPFDSMGLPNQARHMNARSKLTLGWLSPPNVGQVTASGSYQLAPLEQASLGVQILKIPRSPSEYYFLEYRRPFGFDNFDPSDPVVNGVTIRIGDNTSTSPSRLIDTTAGSGQGFWDAPLLTGNGFWDPLTGIKIQTQSVSPETATIYVSLAAPTPPPGCYYQPVQCIQAPCSPVLVCPTPGQNLQPPVQKHTKNQPKGKAKGWYKSRPRPRP